MGSLDPDVDMKQEFDDSGYVQDETGSKAAMEEYRESVNLLDLSDDVLLFILKNLSAHDLKSLGFTCVRLGALVLDHTLWVDVDGGDVPYGRMRVRWMLMRVLGPHTRSLRLTGYAALARGCLGFVHRYKDDSDEEALADADLLPQSRFLSGGSSPHEQSTSRSGDRYPFWLNALVGVPPPPSPPPPSPPPPSPPPAIGQYADRPMPDGEPVAGPSQESTSSAGPSTQPSTSTLQPSASGPSASGPSTHLSASALQSSAAGPSNQPSVSALETSEPGPSQQIGSQPQLASARPLPSRGGSSQVLAAGSQTWQVTSVSQPSTSEPMPSTSDPIPSTSDPIPSLSGPTPSTSDPTPSTSDPIPSASEPIPRTSQPIFSIPESMFSLTEPMISISEPMFSTFEPISSASEPIPSTPEPQPSTSKSTEASPSQPTPAEPSTSAFESQPSTSASPLPSTSGLQASTSGTQLSATPDTAGPSQATSGPSSGTYSSTKTTCPGPQLTFTHTGLRALSIICPNLTALELDYCVIDCQITNIGQFPKSLIRLSLRGTKCYNMEAKTFLFKIQDHLANLEDIDVSFCSWIEPACLLPLSKMSNLHRLVMRECFKLAEFVAYASLATRYGFKTLKVLDLRGSPVGDSEVAALGWLPSLEELYLSPSPKRPSFPEHAHYKQDPLPEFKELADWEETDPEYFRTSEVQEEEWTQDEGSPPAYRNRFFNGEDPSQTYRNFVARQNALSHQAGYSMSVRGAQEQVQEAGRQRRARRITEQMPGPSGEGDKPGTSGHKRKSDKHDDSSSDDDQSPSKVAATTRTVATQTGVRRSCKKDIKGAKPTKKTKTVCTPRRVFEISINDAVSRARILRAANDLEAARNNSIRQDNNRRSAGPGVRPSNDNQNPVAGPSNRQPNPMSVRYARGMRRLLMISHRAAQNRANAYEAQADNAQIEAENIAQAEIPKNDNTENGGERATDEAENATDGAEQGNRKPMDVDVNRKKGGRNSKNEDPDEPSNDEKIKRLCICNRINRNIVLLRRRYARNIRNRFEPGNQAESAHVDRNVDNNQATGNETDKATNDAEKATNEAEKATDEAEKATDEQGNKKPMDVDANPINDGPNSKNEEPARPSNDEPLNNLCFYSRRNRNIVLIRRRNALNIQNRFEPGNQAESAHVNRNAENNQATENETDKATNDAEKATTEAEKTTDEVEKTTVEQGNKKPMDLDANGPNSKNEEPAGPSNDEPLNNLCFYSRRNRNIVLIRRRNARNIQNRFEPGNQAESAHVNGNADNNQATENETDKATNDAEKATNEAEKATNEAEKATNGAEKATDEAEKATDEAEKAKNGAEEGKSKTKDAGNQTRNVYNRFHRIDDAPLAPEQEDRNRILYENRARNVDQPFPANMDQNQNRRFDEAARVVIDAVAQADDRQRPGRCPERQRFYQFRMYRSPIVIEEFINSVYNETRQQRPIPRGVLFAGLIPARLDQSSLVSDSSIRRFGRAMGENILYLGGGPIPGRGNARPDRSNLRILSVTGFRHVTDSSLTHLASAAPHLQTLDLTGTSVSARASQAFRALRPDVNLITNHPEDDLELD